MCRFLLFKGRDPILLADLLTRPAHSIINQSYDSKLRVDQLRPLNGDGFGIGWYDLPSDFGQLDEPSLNYPPTPLASSRIQHQLPSRRKTVVVSASSGDTAAEDLSIPPAIFAADSLSSPQSEVGHVNPELRLLRAYASEDGPCIFTSILPAWNNLNLIRLSEKIKSRLVFAHVRAASPGFPIAETNCHPWTFGKFLWMHNGYISGFIKIKRKLQALLRDQIYHFVQGSTDSEWAFALFLEQFDDPLHGDYAQEDIKMALLKTIAIINALSKEADITEPCLLNFAVSNGKIVVCTRYTNSHVADPASLFYSSGSKFEEYSSGLYRMTKYDKREDIIVISSEPLTFERNDWIPVPVNSLIVVTAKFNVLLYPIPDEYCRSPALLKPQ